MDELNSSFGRLSTNAPEWKPGGGVGAPGPQRTAAAAATSSSSSDLSASQVREFVPGQAWTGAAAVAADASASTQAHHPIPASGMLSAVLPSYEQPEVYQQGHSGGSVYGESSHQQQHFVESTVPSGPNPPPPASSLPPTMLTSPHFRAIHSLGAGDELWRYYREQSLEASRQMNPDDPRHKAIPPPYCNAFCLDPPGSPSRSSFGYPSGTFMVTNRDDGHLYCLRRYDNCRAASGNKVAAAVMERWGNPRSGGGAGAEVQNHPGIVPLVTCFVAQRAFFFVHRLVPGARTLYERLQALRNPQRYHPYAPSNNSGQLLLLPESLLWSCLSQLVSALAAIHGVGLAVRSLDARHVLVTELPPPPRSSADIGGGGRGSASEGDRWRVRINCAGVMEALESETRRHVYEWQQLDLRALGRLVLSMATAGTGRGGALDDGTTSALQSNHAEAEAVLAQNYSRELHNLVMTLLQSGKQLSGGSIGAHRLQHHPNASVPAPSPSIRDVSRALWLHSQAEADRAYRDLDRVEYSLASEYDSSRTLRLLLKLGYVNDRPEFGPNRRWAQSGDCYVLSLFRDYVFHQADGGGYPIMDLGHVITALNKLDAADPEKIVLASRDGISVMVVSFGDVARCLESAFHELCAGGVVVAPPSTLPY